MAGNSEKVESRAGLEACHEAVALELSFKESLFGDHSEKISSRSWKNSDSIGWTCAGATC
jgi:hypothetical protein